MLPIKLFGSFVLPRSLIRQIRKPSFHIVLFFQRKHIDWVVVDVEYGAMLHGFSNKVGWRNFSRTRQSCRSVTACSFCRFFILFLNRSIARSSSSPYIKGKNTPKMPSRQYALSPFFGVIRLIAQLTRSSTLNSELRPLSAFIRIQVISYISCSSEILLTSRLLSHKKNLTLVSTSSFSSVQPCVNHQPRQNAYLYKIG